LGSHYVPGVDSASNRSISLG